VLDPTFLRQAYQAAALVTQMAFIAILGTVAGAALDARLGTEPFGLLTLSAGGLALGLAQMFRGLRSLQGDDDHHSNDAA